MLASLAAYCDWVVILVAAGAIALHHLPLNFLAPPVA
jgi:methyl-accepting chemotaxis protein